MLCTEATQQTFQYKPRILMGTPLHNYPKLLVSRCRSGILFKDCLNYRKNWYQFVHGTSANTRYTKTNPRFNFSHLYVCGAIGTSRGSSVIPLIARQNRFNPNITNRSMTFDIYDAVIRIGIFSSRDGSDGALCFIFSWVNIWTFHEEFSVVNFKWRAPYFIVLFNFW